MIPSGSTALPLPGRPVATETRSAEQYSGIEFEHDGFTDWDVLAEVARCAKMRSMRYGLKLHFGNSDVMLDDPAHVAKLREVFRTANAAGMAIAVHMRSSVTRKRPYGAAQARAFIDEVLPSAPGRSGPSASSTGPMRQRRCRRSGPRSRNFR